MAEFVLYSYYRSSASYRARIALNLKGIPFEYRPVHLLNHGGEQHSSVYRSLNPSEQVPTLIHKGHILAQTTAIMMYLDEVQASPALFPNDAFKKAQVLQFCEIINCVQPLQNLATTQFMDQHMHVSPHEKQAWLDHWLGRAFYACEKMLERTSGSYCFGETLTAADAFLVPQVFAGHRMKIDFTPYPNVNRINKTLLQVEAFQKAHPQNQPDTPKDQK